MHFQLTHRSNPYAVNSNTRKKMIESYALISINFHNGFYDVNEFELIVLGNVVPRLKSRESHNLLYHNVLYKTPLCL